MNILIDMNLSPLWKVVLNKQFPTEHWSNIGPGNTPDKVIFDWAREHQYVIFTNDLDFGTLLAYSQSGSPSVFQLRSFVLDPARMGDAVLKCLIVHQPQLDAGALVTFDGEKNRVRMLPLN